MSWNRVLGLSLAIATLAWGRAIAGGADQPLQDTVNPGPTATAETAGVQARPTAGNTPKVLPTAEAGQTVAPTAGATAEAGQTVAPTAGATAEAGQTVAPTAGATAEAGQTVAPTAGTTAEAGPASSPTPEETATPGEEQRNLEVRPLAETPTPANREPVAMTTPMERDASKPLLRGSKEELAEGEPSLKAYGIESQFLNRPSKKTDDSGADAETEDLSGGATAASVAGISDEDFDRIEGAGEIDPVGDLGVDGKLVRTKEGALFGAVGHSAFLELKAGRTFKVGQQFTVLEDAGPLDDSSNARVGELLIPVGIVRIQKFEGKVPVALIERVWGKMAEGCWLRERERQRKRYAQALKVRKVKPSRYEVLGMRPPELTAAEGGIVFLNFGRAQGAYVGLRLKIFRKDASVGVDDQRDVLPAGEVGTVQVVNATNEGCAARVVKAEREIRPGDQAVLR